MTQSLVEPLEVGKLEYTRDELLSGHPFEEPLIAAGVRCHGGFIDGDYVSPRVLHRGPAIRAWQQRLVDAGEPLLDVPTKYVPPHYPNYPQAKLLLTEGVRDPISRSLTLISIAEGFGARIRDVQVPDLAREVKEDVAGTALAHLAHGLYEAHARDEAGHREEGGHKQMWEAARDLGLDKPELPDDVLLKLMMGGRGRGGRKRLFPELSEKMESAITMMANVLVIEVVAEDVFEWAKKLLGDPEVSADPVGAAAMVANIQSDEKPHVQYLRTALSELRCRTLVSEDGKREFRGADVVDPIFTNALRGAGTRGPQQEREDLQKDIHAVIEDAARATQIGRKFEDLDSGWSFPAGEDEELEGILQSA